MRPAKRLEPPPCRIGCPPQNDAIPVALGGVWWCGSSALPGRIRKGPAGGDGDDGGHNDVDGDDVDDAFGHARELAEETAGVGEDHRLGHPEPADPARPGFGPRRLDDRRTHDAERHVVAVGGDRVGQRLLAERLGVGVGVGPPDAGRAGATGLDQLRLHPAFAQLLGLRGEGGCAGRPELTASFGAELDQSVGLTAGRLGVAAQPTS